MLKLSSVDQQDRLMTQLLLILRSWSKLRLNGALVGRWESSTTLSSSFGLQVNVERRSKGVRLVLPATVSGPVYPNIDL
jgi:hypothetical protein